MRIRYKTQKYLRYSKRRARKAVRRRKLVRQRQIALRRRRYRKPRGEWRHLRERAQYDVTLSAPAKLSFLNNPDSAVEFLSKLEKQVGKTKSLFIEMEQVEEIDYPMISALLAVLYRFKREGVKINGTKPTNLKARAVFEKSGFLYTLFSQNPEAGHRHDINADNQLFTLDTRDLAIVSEIISGVSNCVAGKTKKLPGLYTTLGELMDNTASHASEDRGSTERWWVSINYERSEKKVGFVFVDYGVGIFKSLATKSSGHPVKKTFEKAVKLFGLEATDQHLKSIVTESARTVYRLRGGHGEGIYGIYQAMKRGELQNLYIVSNDAFGNVSGDQYKKLASGLSGTLYYWEIQGINQV